tara:strand:- start:53 stop:1207 length:1155 start_codon:yes stop_codon:yes gene_type:complete
MTQQQTLLSSAVREAMDDTQSKISLNQIHVTIKKGFYFTEEHLNTHLRLHSHDRYPDIYNGDSPEGVSYLDTILVLENDIESDNEFRSQSVRAKNNSEEPAIRSGIKDLGWDLGEMPIQLIKHNGKYKVAEGRTRLLILRNLGVKNIIADIFEIKDETAYIRFGNFTNSKKHPFGKADFLDIKKGVMKVISSSFNKGMNEDTIFEKTETEMKIQSNNKLTKSQRDLIHTSVNNELFGADDILSFPAGDGADEWLIKHDYKNGVNKEVNKHIIYVPCASLMEKFFTRISILDKKYVGLKDKKGYDYEIRLVIHGGVLDAKDHEKDWISKCLNFKKDFKDYEKDISELIYGGAEPNLKSKFVLYGCIPMLAKMNDVYPMKDIVKYK